MMTPASSPPALRIGIDATAWSNPRGFGRFTRSLVSALLAVDRVNRYVLFFDSSYRACTNLPAAARHVVVNTSRAQAEAVAAGRRTAPDLLRMSMAVAREPLDLFFSPSIDGYFPLLSRARKLVTIHDVIPEAHPELTSLGRRARMLRRLKVAVALGQADRLITGSQYARREICRHFRLPQDRVAIVPYGADPLFSPDDSPAAAKEAVSKRHAISDPYLLYVGGGGAHKNLAVLLESFAAIARRPQFAATLMVFAGDLDPRNSPSGIGQSIARLGLRDRVRLLGFQPDKELVAIYRAAEALVLPSIEEGYGLPAIEAVACATPVIATRCSPLPEMLGEAALVVDPRRPEELTLALQTVLGDSTRRERLRAAAREHAGRFGWEHSARRAAAVFAEEAEKLSPPRSAAPP